MQRCSLTQLKAAKDCILEVDAMKFLQNCQVSYTRTINKFKQINEQFLECSNDNNSSHTFKELRERLRNFETPRFEPTCVSDSSGPEL